MPKNSIPMRKRISNTRKVIMNAQVMMKKWQRRLGLGNWEIDFQVLSPEEYQQTEQMLGVEPGGSQALVSPCADRAEAQMNLREGSDRPELSIIHELIHLNQNGMNEIMTQMVNSIDSKVLANSLVELYIAAHECSVHSTARAFYNLQNSYELQISKLKKQLISEKEVLVEKEVTPMGFRLDE